MPSPFPGMDPYLEAPDCQSVHTHLSVEIARYLAPRLRPKYFVRSEKNYILAAMDDETSQALMARHLPDVSVVQISDNPLPQSSVALMEAPLHLSVEIPEEEPHITVEIRDVAERQLVTSIEILSLTNKIGDGRGDYLTRRAHVLKSPVHLLEIDLLRRGQRVPMTEPLPQADYFVILSRAQARPVADVWPISVRGSLPTVPVPLLPGDQDVSLDLQAVLNSMYDAFAFDLEFDYGKPPWIPLKTDDAAWAAQLIANTKDKKNGK